MKSSTPTLLCAFLVACASSSGTGGSQNTSGTNAGATGQSTGSAAGSGSPTTGASSGSTTSGTTPASGAISGSTASGAASAGTSSGGGSTGSGSGVSSGGSAGSGATSGAASTGSGSQAGSGAASTGSSAGATGSAAGSPSGSSSGGTSGTVILPGDGGVNMVPAGYTGTPFTQNVIPGIVWVANYDKGGAGVAYCHAAAGVTSPSMCQQYVKENDWCCGTIKGCDQRNNPTTDCMGATCVCPVYRLDNDNAGLSHMNTGEPDAYASTGPTWAMGANGPTLTGPTVTAGTRVPQDAMSTQVQDVYLSYTYTAEWLKFTVQVAQAGTYAIGGLMGVPAGTTLQLDFGNGISSMFTPPASPCAWAGCPETYHSFNNVSNLGTVTFAAAGTYLMTFTIVSGTINPVFFTFTKQ